MPRPTRSGKPTKTFSIRLDEDEQAVALANGKIVADGVRAIIRAHIDGARVEVPRTVAAAPVEIPSAPSGTLYEVVSKGKVVLETSSPAMAQARARREPEGVRVRVKGTE